MRHLLPLTAMFLFGLAITLGTASLLQDVAISRGNAAGSNGFEVEKVPKAARMPLRLGAGVTTPLHQ